MTDQSVTKTYAIPEPFVPALASVKGALRGENLRIAGQLDLSNRIRRNLHIDIDSCVVLFVWPSYGFLRTCPLRPVTGVLLPLHVVVSAHGSRTDVHLLNWRTLDSGAILAPIGRIQHEMARALETVAMSLSLAS